MISCFFLFFLKDGPGQTQTLPNIAAEYLPKCHLSFLVYNPRKRRRQQWHAKMQLEKRKRHKRKTIDKMEFDVPLAPQRRLLTIAQKLQVLDYYEEMKTEKAVAQEALLEPSTAEGSRSSRKAFASRMKEARHKLKRNLQKLCKQKFPELVRKSQVCKWHATCKNEAWRELPEALRERLTATPNAWREKVGATLKGQKCGSKIPLSIQKELDLLMVELSTGSSDVAERKEIVTVEAVVTCLMFSDLMFANMEPSMALATSLLMPKNHFCNMDWGAEEYCTLRSFMDTPMPN